jgi:hypothetical protein
VRNQHLTRCKTKKTQIGYNKWNRVISNELFLCWT